MAGGRSSAETTALSPASTASPNNNSSNTSLQGQGQRNGVSEQVTVKAPEQTEPTPMRSVSSVHDLLVVTQQAAHLNAEDETWGGVTADNSPNIERQSGGVGPDGLWRRLVCVGGFQTEVYGIHSAQKGPGALKVVVIPGNPGQAAYYLPLLRHLYRQLHGAADVLAVSHKGHGINCSCEQAFSLSEQIQHKVEFVRRYCVSDGSRVALVGHSIGAFMALHVARIVEEGDDDETEGKEARQHGVVQVASVFPFFSVDSRGSGRQSILRAVCMMPGVMAVVASLLGLLPQTICRYVIQLCGGGKLGEHALDSTSLLLRYWNCYNAFHLARTEFLDLSAPPDWHLLRRLGDRACVLTCPRDMWAPDWMMQQMALALPSLRVIHDHSMVHAFCVDEAMSRAVATHLAGVLAVHVDDANTQRWLGRR